MSTNDIYQLSPEERLFLIDQLWDSLDEKEIISPDWHKEVLDKRAEKHKEGKSKLISLEELKQSYR